MLSKLEAMTHRERLEAVFSGQKADRLPFLGGWIACPQHICSIAGSSEQEYWANPKGVSIKAYNRMGIDGLVSIFIPSKEGEYRCVNSDSFHTEKSRKTLDEVIQEIDAIPTPEQIENDFDFEKEYALFRDSLIAGQKEAGDMVWMPAQWSAGAQAVWYGLFGYENYFYVVGLHTDRAKKLMEIGGANGRCRSRLIARAVRERLYPHAVLIGEDICTQRGPMVSPDFLEKYFAPQLRYGLEPLIEAGCKPVWHCDGDVRPILDMIIDCGAQGLQGFQPECGLTIDLVAQKRTRDGAPLLVFGPLSVTTELPKLTPDEIRKRVKHAVDVCRNNADLVLFSANTINPDVPLENILAMYEVAKDTDASKTA